MSIHKELNPKDFRIRQENWLQAIVLYRDENGKRFSPTTLRVAIAMRVYEHANTDEKGQQGTAWPTRASLAKRAGIGGTPKTIRREITTHTNALAKAGFIVKIREGVKPSEDQPLGEAAIWRLAIPAESLKEVENLFEVSGLNSTPTQEGVSGSNHPPTLVGDSTHQHRGSNHPPTLVGKTAHPTHSEATPREHTLNHAPCEAIDSSVIEEEKEAGTEMDMGAGVDVKACMEQFKEAYPKSITRGLLEGPYREQLKQGATPDELLRAAQAYAKECRDTGQVMRYIKFPTKFLKDGIWRDYADMDTDSIAGRVLAAQADREILW